MWVYFAGRRSGCRHGPVPPAATSSCSPDGSEARPVYTSLSDVLAQPRPPWTFFQHGEAEEYVWASASASPGATPTTERGLSQCHEHAAPPSHGSSWNSIQSAQTAAAAEVTGSAAGTFPSSTLEMFHQTPETLQSYSTSLPSLPRCQRLTLASANLISDRIFLFLYSVVSQGVFAEKPQGFAVIQYPPPHP